MSELRPQLGDFNSIVCFKAAVIGIEKALGDRAARVALLAADLVKTSIGMAASAIFFRMIFRPLAQVVRMTKATPPTAKATRAPTWG